VRIGIDATSLYGHQSGVGRAVRGLIAALAKLDDQNEYLLYCGRQEPVVGELRPNFLWRPQPFDVTSRLRVAWWQQRRLDAGARADGVDLLHCPAYAGPTKGTVPMLLSVYDAHVFTHPRLCSWWNRLHYRYVMPPAMRRASQIIAPSCATRDVLVERLGVREERITVAPLGVGEEFRYVPDEAVLEEVRVALELPQEFFLFVGNVEPRKGVPRLIDAFVQAKRQAKLPHKLVIAGKPGARARTVFDCIKAHDAQANVLCLGFESNECLPHLYNLATAVVCPAPWEGFGFPALEAMACGTPVIANNSGALPEICGDAALLVEPRKIAPLAKAIVRMAKDDDLRRSCFAKGLQQAAQFTWPTTAKIVLAAYEEQKRG